MNFAGQTTKQEWCRITAYFNDIIKQNDPNHLTCMGQGAIEAFDWAADATNVDFIAWHFYPYLKYDSEYNDVDLAVNKTLTFLYHTSKTCQLPWIIGEISVSGADFNGTFGGINYTPWMDAQHQKEYVQRILPEIAKSGAAGYMWWYWCDSPVESWISSVTDRAGLFMGVVDLGNNDKPVVEAFETFNNSNVFYQPYSLVQPPGYNNPRGFSSSTTLNTNIKYEDPFSGTFLGAPNSFVLAWDAYEPINPGTGSTITFENQTVAISDDNGDVLLYQGNNPNNPDQQLYEERPFYTVWAGTNGYSTYKVWENGAVLLSSQDMLVYPEATYDVKSNLVVNDKLRAQNRLLVDDIVGPLSSSSEIEITAGREIHFQPGTELGHDIHAFIAPTYPNCNDNRLFRLASPPNDNGNQSLAISPDYKSRTEIDQNYIVPSQIKVYPNPNSGTFSVENSYPFVLPYVLLDVTGRTLYSGTITAGICALTFPELSNGIYLFKVGAEFGEETSLITISR